MLKTKRLDYSHDERFAQVMESFGGEVVLKKQFPQILQMLENTGQWHKTRADMEEAGVGYVDTFRLTGLPILNSYSSAASVYADSLMSMTTPIPFYA